MFEYFPIFLSFLIGSLVAILLLGVSFLASPRRGDPEKVSAYECGFDPFDDSRSRFDIKFYLVAILFIIFDLEVTFLFPWAMVLKKVNFFGFWSTMVFLLVLTIGFLYKWRKGAFQGDHTAAVQMGLGFGFILFITSGIIFFVVFFWPFFNSSFAAIVEIKTFCSLKVVNFGKEWTTADYGVFVTLFATAVLCGIGWLMKKDVKNSNRWYMLSSVTIIAGLAYSFTLFCLEPAQQKEISDDINLFLGLSFLNQLSFLLILFSILVAYYIFKMVRNWVITTFSITLYYLLVMGVRAGFLFYKLDVQLFLSVEVGSILLALVWVFCKRKPDPILEWGKLLVELVKVVFYMQLTLVIAGLLSVVYSQPTPSVWVYTTIVVLLFEVALCLGKVLVEMTASDGFLWGDFSGAIEQIRRLVSPDHIPAFQGGEEWSQEQAPPKEVPNTSRMTPANQGQGGLPSGSGGPLPGVPNPPLSGQFPNGVIVKGENGEPVVCLPYDPYYAFYPKGTLPGRDFPAGQWVNNPTEEVPTTYDGSSLLELDVASKKRFFEQMPYRIPHLQATSTLRREDPGTIICLENAARTRGGLYLQEHFYEETGLPKYGWYGYAGHLDLGQGRNYCWTGLNMKQLKEYLILKRRPDLAAQVFLKENSLRFFSYGELRFKFASAPYQNHPSVTGLYYNNTKYCLESEQPARNPGEYVRAIITSIRDRDDNVNFPITTNARDKILSEMSRRITAGGQGQVVGAGPHPDQGAATGSVQGQPQPEQLLPLPAGGQGQVVGAGPHPDQGAATGSVQGQPQPEQLLPLPAGGQGQVVGAGPHPDQGAATGSVQGQPQPEQLVPLPAGGQGQVVGAGPHPDQGAATGRVEGQPQPERLSTHLVGAGDQPTGLQPDQGRAGADGDGQSDQPTPPVNRGATPRAQVSDAAQTVVRGGSRSRGRGGGRGGGRGHGRLILINPSLEGVNPQLGGVGPEIDWAAIADQWGDQPSESSTELALRYRD